MGCGKSRQKKKGEGETTKTSPVQSGRSPATGQATVRKAGIKEATGGPEKNIRKGVIVT